MRRVRLVAIFLLAAVLVPAISALSAPDEADVEVLRAFWATPDGGNPYPGVGPVKLVVYLKNIGSGSLKPDLVILNLPRPLRTLEGDNQSWATLPGPLPVGQVVRLDFDVFVPASARPGRYNFSLELNYTEVRVQGWRVVRETRQEAVSFLLTLREGPEIRALLSAPESAPEGEVFKAWLRVENEGSEQISIQSIRVSSPNAEVLTPDLGAPGPLSPRETMLREVYVRVPTGSGGDLIILTASVTYGVGGDVRVEEVTTSVRSTRSESRFSVTVDREGLVPGEENAVELTLKNVGSATAEDVRVSLTAPEGLTVIGPSEYWVGDLPPGEEVRLEVKLLPVGSLPAYGLTVAVSPSGEQPETVLVGFSSLESGNVSIASLRAEYDGEKMKIRGILANLGSGAARYVNVTVMDGPCRGESSYIGDLDSGETSGFYLSCGDLPQNGAEVNVSVFYQASPGNWKVSTKSVQVEIPEASSSPSEGVGTEAAPIDQTLTYLAAAAGIISGFFVGKIYAERRRG